MASFRVSSDVAHRRLITTFPSRADVIHSIELLYRGICHLILVIPRSKVARNYFSLALLFLARRKTAGNDRRLIAGNDDALVDFPVENSPPFLDSRSIVTIYDIYASTSLA